MGSYFIEKIVNIQVKLDNMASGLSARPSASNSLSTPIHHYGPILSENDVAKLIINGLLPS